MQKVLRRRQALQGLVNDWQGRGRVFEIVEMNHCKLSGRPVVVTWSQRDSLCYCKKLSQGTCGTQLLNVVSEGAHKPSAPSGMCQSSALTHRLVLFHTIPGKQMTTSPHALVHLAIHFINRIFYKMPIKCLHGIYILIRVGRE